MPNGDVHRTNKLRKFRELIKGSLLSSRIMPRAAAPNISAFPIAHDACFFTLSPRPPKVTGQSSSLTGWFRREYARNNSRVKHAGCALLTGRGISPSRIEGTRMKKLLWVTSFLCCAAVQGADVVWTNVSGGNWGTAANWSPNQVPTLNDTAWITN